MYFVANVKFHIQDLNMKFCFSLCVFLVNLDFIDRLLNIILQFVNVNKLCCFSILIDSSDLVSF